MHSENEFVKNVLWCLLTVLRQNRRNLAGGKKNDFFNQAHGVASPIKCWSSSGAGPLTKESTKQPSKTFIEMKLTFFKKLNLHLASFKYYVYFSFLPTF